MFFFEIKGGTERRTMSLLIFFWGDDLLYLYKRTKKSPEDYINAFIPAFTQYAPSWSKNNALLAAQYNISFNGIGPAFFEWFQEGGPTALKGSSGKVFNRTIPQIEVAKNSVKN